MAIFQQYTVHLTRWSFKERKCKEADLVKQSSFKFIYESY